MIERNQLWLDAKALSINKSRCRYSKTIICQSVNESGGYLPRRVATQWISSTIHLHHGEQLLNIIDSLHEIHNFDRTATPNITKKTQGKISSQPHTSLGLEFVDKQSNDVNDRLCKFIDMLLKGNSKRLLYFAFGTTALFRVGRNITKGKIMLLDSFRKFNLRWHQ